MAHRTETYACQHCGTDVMRKVARGQRPKWCDDCRTLRLRECPGCHEPKRFMAGNKHCPECVDRLTAEPVWTCDNCGQRIDSRRKYCGPECGPDQRSDLRRAIECEDWQGAVLAMRRKCRVVDGCWVWQCQRTKDGYPVVRVGHRKRVAAHRLMLSLANGGVSVGVHSAHHKCANTMCVNPDHLATATHAENAAEMMARRSYVLRIAELEEALRVADPLNRALQVLPFA